MLEDLVNGAGDVAKKIAPLAKKLDDAAAPIIDGLVDAGKPILDVICYRVLTGTRARIWVKA